MTAYLDPYTFHRMKEGDKNLAMELISKTLSSSDSTGQSPNISTSNLSQPQRKDSLDLSLIKCGIETNGTSTIINHSQPRSADEELAFYYDKVQKCESFEQFWNTYQYDLPRMVTLVGAYNIRPATSVASESLFSIAGYVHRKQRSSLAPNTLRYSMALRDRNVLASLL